MTWLLWFLLLVVIIIIILLIVRNIFVGTNTSLITDVPLQIFPIGQNTAALTAISSSQNDMSFYLNFLVLQQNNNLSNQYFNIIRTQSGQSNQFALQDTSSGYYATITPLAISPGGKSLPVISLVADYGMAQLFEINKKEGLNSYQFKLYEKDMFLAVGPNILLSDTPNIIVSSTPTDFVFLP